MPGLLLALFLPWALGYLGLELLYRRLAPAGEAPSDSASPLPLLLGYGYLLGLFCTTLLLRLWDALGLRLAFAPLALLLLGLCLVAIILARRAGASRHIELWALRGAMPSKIDGRTLIALAVLGLILVRLVSLGTEVWLRPLFPWDAWSAWAQKTAVWFDLRALAPFVAPSAWPGSTTAPLFTAPAFNYPPTIPLIQLWTLLGLGHWDDALMNLPWLLCCIALGLAFYGQTRRWGLRPLPALVWVYLLLSLPLLDTHVALAGNADLWLATSYGFALIALLQWMRFRERHQAVLGVLAALMAIQTKAEGLVWVLTLAPALLLAMGRKVRPVLLLLTGLAVLAGLTWLAAPIDIALPGLGRLVVRTDLIQIPGLIPIALGHHAVALPLLRHMFAMGNWNLLWPLVTIVLLAGLPRLRHDPVLVAAYLALGGGAAFLGFLFGFTEMGLWVEQATILNRLLLHAVPAVLFVTLITVEAIRVAPAGSRSAPPGSPGAG